MTPQAGVEMVWQFGRGSSDGWPDTHNELCADPSSAPPRPPSPAQHKDVSREEMDHFFGVRSKILVEAAPAREAGIIGAPVFVTSVGAAALRLSSLACHAW